MTTAPVSIRSLTYSDLPQVIAIERRVFPTPWSLAMFVLELSKPSGVCLAGTVRSADGRSRLVGYLICSRYDTVWHVMNIAVDAAHQRRGLASALLSELYLRVGEQTCTECSARVAIPIAADDNPWDRRAERWRP